MRTQFALQGKNVVFKSMASFIAHTYHTSGFKGKNIPYNFRLLRGDYTAHTMRHYSLRCNAGFYAGLVPAMVGITPQMGLNFAFYETFRAIAMPEPLPSKLGQGLSLNGKKDSLGWATVKKGICGGAAGGLSKLIVYPLVRHSRSLAVSPMVVLLFICKPLSHQ